MKAATDAGEEYYDPTREDNIKRRNETRLALWEEHLRDPTVALDKALKCVENSVLKVSAQALEVRSPNGCCWLPSKLGGEAYLGGRLVLLGFDGYCVFTHSTHGVECVREVWARCAPFLHDSEEASNCAEQRGLTFIHRGWFSSPTGRSASSFSS